MTEATGFQWHGTPCKTQILLRAKKASIKNAELRVSQRLTVLAAQKEAPSSPEMEESSREMEESSREMEEYGGEESSDSDDEVSDPRGAIK